MPIDAIVFGGRRASTVPLVYEATDWTAGVYAGATMTSEKTAAAAGAVGEVRFDPMAMLPFCGYHMADYWQHWLNLGATPGAKLPRIFHVNWFRKDAAGRFLWPGFGQNLRVLEWIAARCRGEAAATPTPLGLLPTSAALDFAAAGVCAADAAQLLEVSPAEWLPEIERRTTFLARFADRLPPELAAANTALRERLEAVPE